MKDFTRPYSLLVLSVSFIVSIFYCLSLPAIAGNDTKNQDKRTIRVTTGIQQVQGWEQGLVRANPNLARWHWDPIYSYKQGYAKIGPESTSLKNGPTGNKIRGNPGGAAYKYNVPAPQDNRPKRMPFSSKALAEVQARYSQPATPQAESNLYGQISNKQTRATVLPTIDSPPTVATYGRPYASQEKLGTNLKYSSDKTAVYGQLLNKKQKIHSSVAKTKKQNALN